MYCTSTRFDRSRLAFVLVAFISASPVVAQEGLSIERRGEYCVSEQVRATENQSVVVEGHVFNPDGSPAKSAIVLSSAGGRALTDESGEYLLALEVSSDVQRFRITGVSGKNADHIASHEISFAPGSRTIASLPLQLSQSNSCSPAWLPTFGAFPGTDMDVFALEVFDDGSGPALIVAGSFIEAGGVSARRIAKWDGSEWSPLGTGVFGQLNALVVFDDGNGPALYLGGSFTGAGGVSANSIAKWDGAVWAPVGSGTTGTIRSLEVWDDGGGDALFAGGDFAMIGGSAANNIAKWDGAQWTALGAGVSGLGSGEVYSLHGFDDGGGQALYAGGLFDTAGASAANSIGRWDGSNWSALGSGVSGIVRSMQDFDDGSGLTLFVGGTFTSAGGVPANHLAKWSGSTWSSFGSGISGPPQQRVDAMSVFDDGSGPALYIGGRFDTVDGNPIQMTAKWNGANWSPLGLGVNSTVLALAQYDDGSGNALFAGGRFTIAGTRAAGHVAKWSGSNWRPLGSGFNSSIQALAVYDDGGGNELYVGGTFTAASGATPALRIAKWDGAIWAPVGAGIGVGGGTVRALEVFNDGGGPALYAGGQFSSAGGVPVANVAKWDGTSWTEIGDGLGGSLSDFAVYDDGGGNELYAAGEFTTLGPGTSLVAKWDGASWTSVGVGMQASGNPSAEAFEIYNDGGGDGLYFAGDYDTIGGVAAKSIARWDGSNWSPLGLGLDGVFFARGAALTVFDDGGGPELYVGGTFTSAGGVPGTRNLAKWSGSTWSSVAGDLFSSVFTLQTHDDGSGLALYAGGGWSSIGSLVTNGIAKWNGADWSSLGSGIEGSIFVMGEFDDGNGPALFVGGLFDTIEGSGDSYFGKWGCSSSQSLTSDASNLSLSAGGTQTLFLDAGTSRADWFYVMLGTFTGTSPGIDIGSGLILPLNSDSYFTITRFRHQLKNFNDFRGTLDASGQATASLTVFADMNPSLTGVTLHHAFLAGEVFSSIEFASNAVPTLLVP